MNKIEQAKEISVKYGFPLIRKWEGYKLFWHVWHQIDLVYFITYEEYIDRIIEIEKTKPEKQRQERYQLMKPVKQKFKVDAAFYAAWEKASVALQKASVALQKAYAARQKANTVLQKAYTAWEKTKAAWQKTYAAWEKAKTARQKIYDEWETKNHDLILLAHEKECPDCKWDGFKLPQMEEA